MFTRTTGMVSCGMPGRCLGQKVMSTGQHWLFRARRPTAVAFAYGLHRRWAHEVSQVVRQVIRTFPKIFAASHRHDVEHHVWLKISEGKYRPPAATFELAPFMAWCRRVASNKLKSLYKKWIRSTGGGQEFDADQVHDGRSAEPMFETLDELRRVCVTIREELDGMLSGYGPFDLSRHRQRGQVDYYAVLLMRTRLEIARLVAPTFQVREAVAEGEVSRKVAEFLPWTGVEQQRAFRQGMPTLSDIWQSLEPLLNSGEHWLDGRMFWEHLTILPEAGVTLAQKNQWDNWHRRVCQHLMSWIHESSTKDSMLSDRELNELWQKKWGALFDFPKRKKRN
ncbi:MAG: hypothetical protein R3C18_04625 [Planctomycetaceae bacterium]